MGNLRERDHWGDQGIDERIILRWMFRKLDVGVWTGLSWLRRERWQALANVLMNLVSINAGNFLTSCKLVSF
jgi:hypothetical protein